jgi:threonine dehydrogenase-like Zn-dependent dehydrogenase
MKALVYTGPLAVAYRDEPDPVAGPGEAVLAVEAVGICGSDMHGYHGHDPRRVPPLVLGHEAVGRVVGGARERRVVVNPLITCMRCDACLGGRANLCAERTLIGMNRPGAFAEIDRDPRAEPDRTAGWHRCGRRGADRAGRDRAAMRSISACARSRAPSTRRGSW